MVKDMDSKKINEIHCNDGGGMYDNEGICESMIVDLNDMTKAMAAGQYVRYCSLLVGMVQKLTNLKKAIRTEKEDMKQQLKDLERLNNELAEKAFNVPANVEAEETEEDNNGQD